MRIIAGALGGRLLKSPQGADCRPAMGRTREALFSMLGARGILWEEVSVMDIFAGSGSLALEALSRGARRALVVENSPRILRCLRANVASLGLGERVDVVTDDALGFLRRGAAEPFDLVFIDPPYRKDLVSPALRFLVEKGWLADGALVSAETEKDLRFTVPDALREVAERLFGQTRVRIWRHRPGGADRTEETQ